MVQVMYKDHKGLRIFKWKVCDNRPPPHIIHGTLEIVANGTELRYIRAAIKLPIDVDKRLPAKNVRWFGDHAKFILANLRE